MMSYEEKIKQAKEIAEERGLPELEGTKKQINWATIIRNNVLDSLDGDEMCGKFTFKEAVYDYYDYNKNRVEFFDYNKEIDFETFSRLFDEAIEKIKNETKAKFWIDIQHKSAFKIIGHFLKTDDDLQEEKMWEENDRVITAYKDYLHIKSVTDEDIDLFDEIKVMTGRKRQLPNKSLIPIEGVKEVIEFGNKYGYKYTNKAKKLLQKFSEELGENLLDLIK